MISGGFGLEVCDPAAKSVAELIDCGCAVTHRAKVQNTKNVAVRTSQYDIIVVFG